jgi:hypothetical protein
MHLNSFKNLGLLCSLLAFLGNSEVYAEAVPCQGVQLLQPGLAVIAPDPNQQNNYINLNLETAGEPATNILVVLQNLLGGFAVSTLKVPAAEPKSMQISALKVLPNGEMIEEITHIVRVLALGEVQIAYLLPGTNNHLLRWVNLNSGTENCSVEEGPIPADAAPTTTMRTLTPSSYGSLFSSASFAALQTNYNNQSIEMALLKKQLSAYDTALDNALDSRIRLIEKNQALAKIFATFSSKTSRIAAKSRESSTRAAMLSAIRNARAAIRALD